MLEAEASWWGDCTNTFHEEQKQLVYARQMGITFDWGVGHPPSFNLDGKSVLDLGGGPASLLLKTHNPGRLLAVVDPCPYPDWVEQRYAAKGIALHREEAETFRRKRKYDEAWIYNVLQHVRDPEAVITTASKMARRLRIFEWIDVPTDDLHAHRLTREALEGWIGTAGSAAHFNESGCVGRAFFGIFE